jgi:hypothetical protein
MRKNGVLEYWSVGVLETPQLRLAAGSRRLGFLVVHHSTRPLQHSDFSHHSITPPLLHSFFF